MSGASLPDALSITALNALHDRAAFICGVESLEQYLKTQAGQDVRRKANAVFVMSPEGAPEQVIGYYTLCATAIARGDVPEAALKHLPRYPLVSCTLIGRLAIAKTHQGQGLGSILLADALTRAFLSADTVGSSMIVVDALNETASNFYAAHGFVRLPESLRLVLPMRNATRHSSDIAGMQDRLARYAAPDSLASDELISERRREAESEDPQ